MDFNKETDIIREWVNGGGVERTSLAAELFAWYHYVADGFDTKTYADVMRKSSVRLVDLFKDDD